MTRLRNLLQASSSPEAHIGVNGPQSPDRTQVGKLRPGGHVWPNGLFNLARRAFTIVSPKAKSGRSSAWSRNLNWEQVDRTQADIKIQVGNTEGFPKELVCRR